MIFSLIILRGNDGGIMGVILAGWFVGWGILYFIFPNAMGREKQPSGFINDIKDRFNKLVWSFLISIALLTLAGIVYFFTFKHLPWK